MMLIGTSAGLYGWDESRGNTTLVGLKSKDVQGVVSDTHGNVFVSLSDNTVWQSADAGHTWQQLQSDTIQEEITVIFAEPSSGELYVGTEPPKIYRFNRTDKDWQLLADLSRLEVAKTWYTPWGGPPAVRSMAASDEGLYLDIHVGGILRSFDGGETWKSVSDGLHLDVHQVATSDRQQHAVYAATAGGFYLSEDQGKSWEARNTGLPNRYTRGIAIHPDEPKTVLISGSPTSPGGWRTNGKRFALFRTVDQGAHWEKVTRGLPEASDAEIDTHSIAFSPTVPDIALCGLRSGMLYASDDAGASWSVASDALPSIHGLCAV